jgi:peptidyl-prolyl cis-trans isomerase B (cyclophilin B)
VTSDPYAPAQYLAPPRPTNVLAIISLIASCVGFTVPGIIMGHIALHQIKRTGEGGHGLALAGVIVGYVLFAIVLILVVVYVLVIIGIVVWANANASNFSNFG